MSAQPAGGATTADRDPVSGRKFWRVGTLTYTTGGVVVLFLWLLFGDFAWSMRDRSVGPMAQWYLKSLDVPNVVFGLLVASFPAVIGMILGPIISVKSDRHRGRRGRRIPFLLVTTPIAAFGMIGLAATPLIARWMHRAFGAEHAFGAWLHRNLDGSSAGAWVLAQLQNEVVVAVACFAVFWAAFEFATIAAYAVFGGLINDVVPKPLLGRFHGLFRAVSLIDGMIFNYWVMGHVPEHFTLILATVGVFYGTAFMWVCFKVKEGGYPPPPVESAPAATAATTVRRDGRVRKFGRETATYFRECFTNSYYVSVFVMLMCAAVAFAPINIYSIPFAQSLGVDMKVYGRYLALSYLISLGLAWFLGWLADRFHPLRVAIVSLAGYLAVTIFGAAFARTAETFLLAWVMHSVLSGCYFTASASIGQRLFPHWKYAQFASAGGLVLGFGNMVVAPATGLLVDANHGLYHLTFAVGAALSVVALVAAWFAHRGFMRFGGPRGYVAPEA